MPRRRQPRGTKGSLKWIQDLVNLHPDVLDEAIEDGPVEWRSPLADDDYAEYWTRRSWTGSGSFSVAGPCTHSGHRADRGGDALGLILGQRVVLVEAKAHRDEVRSLSRAGAESRSKIEAAFRELAGTWRISDTS